MEKANLKRVNGALKVSVDGEIIEPLSFKSFRPTKRNISDFAKAGVRLFSILSSGVTSALGVPYSLFGESWIGDHKYNFDPVDKQIELFLDSAPEGYFALMIQLDTRDWYLKDNPDIPNSFRCLSQALCCKKWKEDAADYLQAMIRHTEEKYGDRFYGYFMLCGFTTEWFSHFDKEASHPKKEKAWQIYRNDPQAKIPSEEVLNGTDGKAFLLPRYKEEVRAFRKFHAESVADSILYFAGKAQEVIKHKKLLGVYFGYLMELSGPRLWNDGHLAYEKVFTSPDIDMISSPSSYLYRSEDSTSAFMVTFDTLDKHDKLYYLEFDHITHLSPEKVGDIIIPGGKNKCKSEEETLNLMQRDFMLCAAKGAALWWFDMFEGWFYSDGMMEAIREMIEIQKHISERKNESCAEILVIADSESLYGVNKNSGLNTLCLGKQLEGLMRMGAPFDLISLCDLEKTDTKKYKLIIFLDAFSVSEKSKRWIEKEAKTKSVLYLYAPDYDKNGIDGIREITKMNVSPLLDEEENVLIGKEKISIENLPYPRFFIEDENIISLGAYENSKKVCLGMKETAGGKIFYCTTANLSGGALQKTARLSGVHIYCEDTETPQYTSSLLKCVYNLKDTTLFVEDGEYIELFTKESYFAKNGRLFVPKGKRASKMFMKKIL